jgi:orotate phosphoribosyltransferase-like protein
MPLDMRKQWGADAKAVLENRCLQHIIGKSVTICDGVETNGEVIKRCIEAIARHSKSHEETENIRMTMNGIELVRELLEEMLYQEEKTKVEEPYAPL